MSKFEFYVGVAGIIVIVICIIRIWLCLAGIY
jgi:hypothetical protein